MPALSYVDGNVDGKSHVPLFPASFFKVILYDIIPLLSDVTSGLRRFCDHPGNLGVTHLILSTTEIRLAFVICVGTTRLRR